MEVLTFDLVISDIVSFDADSFKSDPVYLWVLHADKIPPHIGISSEGNYFSLKSKGKDENLCVDQVSKLVQKKGIKTLLFQLDSDLSSKEVEDQFSFYSKTKTNLITCINPIRDLLSNLEARMLKELLAELKEENRISKVIGFNIDTSFKGIQDYTMDDIHDRLRKLDNVG